MQAFRYVISIGIFVQIAIVQAQPRSAVDTAVEFIVGNCFYALDDISRVKSAARLFKWETLSPEAANMLKPVDGKEFEAWHVQTDGQHFFVGVSHGTFQGRPAEICSVVANQPPDLLLPRLLARVKVRKVNEDTDPTQAIEIYELQHPTENKAVMSIVRATDGRPPVSVGFMGVH